MSLCTNPVDFFTYEALNPLSELARLELMRDKYCEASTCYQLEADAESDTDVRLELQSKADNYKAACYNLNQSMVTYGDGVTTNDSFLRATRLGSLRDELSDSTRRSTPLGTVIAELTAWLDTIRIGTTPLESTFDIEEVLDTVGIPLFGDINFTAQKVIDDTEFSTDHKSCLTSLPCTFKEPKVKDVVIVPIEAVDVGKEKYKPLALDVDVTIEMDDISTGCYRNDGKDDGLFDRLMKAVDTSVNLQYKNNRLDAKSFALMYSQTLQATMQSSVDTVVRERQLLLDKAKLDILLAEYNSSQESTLLLNRLKVEESKYAVVLTKANIAHVQMQTKLVEAQVKEATLRVQERTEKIPIELSTLVQEAKYSETRVEHSKREIEDTRANTIKTYRGITETKANGKLDRELMSANLESTRVNTRVAKFDVLLKKEQAYYTKIRTREEQANGSSNRRLISADVQSKNNQALVYKGQAKDLVFKQREEVAKLAMSMWSQQMDSAGVENMVVDNVKGARMSSMMERALIDVGL